MGLVLIEGRLRGHRHGKVRPPCMLACLAEKTGGHDSGESVTDLGSGSCFNIKSFEDCIIDSSFGMEAFLEKHPAYRVQLQNRGSETALTYFREKCQTHLCLKRLWLFIRGLAFLPNAFWEDVAKVFYSNDDSSPTCCVIQLPETH